MAYIRRKSVAVLSVALATGLPVSAEVTGRVKDMDGNPLEFATVFWSKTSVATRTDIDGRFTIEKPKKSNRLVISYLGYENDTVTVNDDETVDVTLSNNHNLDEVRVVARSWGVLKSKGSVANQEIITSAELARAACCNLGESFNAYQQNPDGTRTNLLATGQFHGDIWGGMALSMGLMGAGKATLSGVQYASMKHGVNKADARATELLGKEIWEPLRATIDLTKLSTPEGVRQAYSDEEFVALTRELTEVLHRNRTIDWNRKESARAKMRVMVKRLLKKYKYPPEGAEKALETVMRQCDHWADDEENVV